MFGQVAGVFANAAVRRHGRAYLLGLLSHQERKNGWTLAEFAGEVSPDGMQRLLNFSPWDEDACWDAMRRYVTRNLGDAGAVLAVDETGFLKKGRMSGGGGPHVYRGGWRTARWGVPGVCGAGWEQGAGRPGAVPAEEVGR